MTAIFGIIATPMGYVMEYIYAWLQNYGYSVMVFALLAKIVMLPLSIKQKRSMIGTQRIQPELNKLQKKYGNDREKYSVEAQKLFDKEGVSPTGGCGTTLLTFPIMLGLYYVVTMPLSYFMHLNSEEINALAQALDVATNKFGFQLTMAGMFKDSFEALKLVCDKIINVDFGFYGLNLTLTPNFKEFSVLWILPVLSVATSFLMSRATMAMTKYTNKELGIVQDEKTQQMSNSMMLFMPLMSGYFSFILPAAVSIYWISNNIFSAVQELILTKYCLNEIKKEEELIKTGGRIK